MNGKDGFSGHSRNLLRKDKDDFEGVVEEIRSWCNELTFEKDSNEGIAQRDTINKGQHVMSMGECVRVTGMENM